MNRRHIMQALVLLTGLTAMPAAAASLAPHEARFSLSLATVNGPDSIASAGGEMVFRIERTCTGWTVLSRLVFDVALDAERGMRIDSFSGLTESLDGRTLSFEHQTSFNGRPTSGTRGTASVGDDGQPGRAIYSLPERFERTLAPGTVLPVAATEATLAAFAKGQKLRSYIQFDGQSPDGPMRIAEIVSGTPRPLAATPKGDVALLQPPVWRVASSFFGLDAEAIEPAGTQMSEMHANGVIRRLRLDLDMMTVDAELIEIKALPIQPC